MRSFFGSIALEEHQGQTALSLEEEQVQIDEAIAADDTATQELDNAERALAVSDNIEDLAVINDNIEETTPTEAALINNSMQNAVAGTETEAGDLVKDLPDMSPATEGYIGRKVSSEGLRETARNIWEAVKRILKKVWKYITDFYNKIFGDVARLRKSVESARSMAKDLGKNKKSDDAKFTLGSGLNTLYRDGKHIKSAGELETGLKANLEACEFVYGEYAKGIEKAGTKMATLIGEFDYENPKDTGNKVIGQVFSGAKFGTVATLSTATGGEKDLGKLMCDHTLVYKYKEFKADETVTGKLEKLRMGALKLEQTSSKASDVSDIEFTTMKSGDMLDVLSTADKILDKLDTWVRGANQKDLRKTADKMETASSKAEKAVGKAEGKSENMENVAVYRALVNLNKSYADWAKEPAAALFRDSLSAVRITVALVHRSASTYKTA